MNHTGEALDIILGVYLCAVRAAEILRLNKIVSVAVKALNPVLDLIRNTGLGLEVNVNSSVIIHHEVVA